MLFQFPIFLLSYIYAQYYFLKPFTMQIPNPRLLIYLLLFSIVIEIYLCEDWNLKSRLLQSHQDNQYEPQKKQYELQQQFKKQTQEQLNDWIVQQMRQNQQYEQVQPHQSAIFYLKPNVTHLYRIPASLKQKKRLQVSLFQVGADGQIVLPDNPSQNSFVQVFSSTNKQSVQYKEGIVYISKIFQIKFQETHKFFKLKNRAQTPFIVLLDLEEEQLLMDIIISDDRFALTKKKIQTVMEEAKNTELNREHVYKWQWGFYQKHWRHQADILGFNAAELLIVIGTSIVQIYSIKSLIENQLII